MPDPNLHWDGRQWLRWDGSEWVPDPDLPPPDDAAPSATPKSGGSKVLITALVAVVVVALLAGVGVWWLAGRESGQPTAATGTPVVTVPIGGAQASFTDPVGEDLSFKPKTTSSPQSVSGGQAGLYGGTMQLGSCDREKLIAYLEANPDKANAWAGVLGIQPTQIRKYVMGLTSMVLRRDTYVINHGYVDGRATAFPSVLQSGTAVLVGKHGLPVVRCYCGNPLTQPPAITQDVTFTGPTWPGWNPQSITMVTRQMSVVTGFILVDVRTGDRFVRPPGTNGGEDHEVGQTPAPVTPAPVTPAPVTPTPRSSGTTPPPDYPTDYPTQYPQDTSEPDWDYCDEYPEECYPEDYSTDYPYPDEGDYETPGVG